MVKTILILTADPRHNPRRRLDMEVREINHGITRGHNRALFHIEQKWAVNPDDLRRAMLDYDPQIVHFCGYGYPSEGITLEHSSGGIHLVSSDALSGLFELFANQVECVLLSACYSELQAQAISKYIEYVIGMKQSISHEAATQFSIGFYDALSAGRNYEEAFQFGQNSIQLYNITEDSTPVLKRKRAVVEWNIKLDLSLNDLEETQINEIIKLLKASSEDADITLQRIEADNLIVFLSSSEQGLIKIETLSKDGKLNKLGATVQEVSVNPKIPTILILEDNEMWLARHERRLRDAGFKCHSTQVAEEAINIAKLDSSIKFALIDEVLFIPPIPVEPEKRQLQRWLGSGVIRELRPLRPDIQFIMVTSAPEYRSKGNSQLFRRETSKLKLIPGVIDVIHQQDIDENPEVLYEQLFQYIRS